MLLDAEKGRIYVEQINPVPQMPGCASDIAEPAAPRYVIDLTLVPDNLDATGWFLIRNDSLDGFVLDDMAIDTVLPGEGDPVSDLRAYQAYVPPGNGGMVSGVVLARAAIQWLGNGLGCPRVFEYTSSWSEYKGLIEEIGAQDAFPLDLESSVEFRGHTTSGLKKTVLPMFVVDIVVCCGCLLRMSNCADECGAFCTEPEEGPCSPGIGNAVEDAENTTDCRTYFYNADSQWTEETILEDGGVGEETVGCADCAG